MLSLAVPSSFPCFKGTGPGGFAINPQISRGPEWQGARKKKKTWNPPTLLSSKSSTRRPLRLKHGDVGLAGEIDRLYETGQKLKREKSRQGDAPREDDDEELGMPERLRVKRPYTMSEDARLARVRNAQKSTGPRTEKGKKRSAANGRYANWKHGACSASVIARTFGVCTKRCPKYPCEAVQNSNARPRQLCMDYEGLPLKIKTFVEAAETGDIKQVKELGAVLLAMHLQNVENMLINVHMDGPMVKEDIYNSFGELIGQKYRSHPNLQAIIDSLHKLGLTLPAMRMTPQELQKTRDGEEDRNIFGKALESAAAALAKVNAKDDG
jgi:hypothetical protein